MPPVFVYITVFLQVVSIYLTIFIQYYIVNTTRTGLGEMTQEVCILCCLQKNVIRIMRALSDGELVSVSNICAAEQLPSAMTYKITRKLEKQGLLKSCRGTNGGYCLNRTLSEISLYDICAAVDPDILLLECMKDGYHCSMNNQQKPCLVHREFCRLQSMLLQEMRQKSLSELFFG